MAELPGFASHGSSLHLRALPVGGLPYGMDGDARRLA